MKPILHFIVAFFVPITLLAQVGIGTTNPNASLDIIAQNPSAPTSEDGLLIPRIDDFPASDPGAAQDGMLVFATGNGTPSKGFYYWDNGTTSWAPFSGGDADWHRASTTSPPGSINDNLFTLGQVAIGKNNPSYSLDVEAETTAYDRLVNLYGNTDTNTGNKYNIFNEMEYNGAAMGQARGMYNVITGAGNGEVIGQVNGITNSGDGEHVGVENRILGSGSGVHYGVINRMTANSNSYINGVRTLISGTGTGTQTGHFSWLSVDGSNLQTGSYNFLSGDGTGVRTGTENFLQNSSSGDQNGTSNTINNSGTADTYGVRNNLGSSGTGIQRGIYNNITNSGNANHYGLQNSLNGTGAGNHYGSYSFLNGSGSGTHYGVLNSLVGVGTGDQYGIRNDIFNSGNSDHYAVYNNIDNSGGGDHYGIYNRLQGNSAGQQIAIYNYMGSTSDLAQFGKYTLFSNSGNGNQYGDYNNMGGTGSGETYGTFNAIASSGSGDKYGSYQNFSGNNSTTQYGTYHRFQGTGGITHGLYNRFEDSGNDNRFGVFNNMASSGSGSIYGNYTTISGAGAGTKIGTYVSILTGVGGQHYGLYSDVRKSGSFAGYFLGRVSIGTTGTNNYILPAVRGTANQVMQTDGVGNVSWATLSTGVTANNGLSASGNNVALGGSLNQNTTITHNTFSLTHNLNSSGDFIVQDAGLNHFEVRDNGNTYLGGDTYWFDESTSGTLLASLTDLGDDGIFTLFNNGAIQHYMPASGNVTFNEQGLATNFAIESDTEPYLFFVRGNLDRIGIMTTIPTHDLTIKQSNTTQASAGGLGLESASSTANWKVYHSGSHLSFAENGVRRAYVEAGTGNYVITSDKRLKKNISSMESVLSKVNDLDAFTYLYKDQQTGSSRSAGFMAQEVKTIFPDAVKMNEEGFYGINYDYFTVMAIKAIQEQQLIIESQEIRLEKLERELGVIKAMLNK
ncbi:tail fiber domain-containing protein [Aureitalea sp. L0-47]|uniref:tail fiber domain-containing protein n=1 Tax=Aureitalea sp. L0-47 TaxID=2816962 RepID=UPI0022380783|nr:tail fiber domain-containing protein [Aureitalea sp. L0-47]MCW5519479.1 tail fiber domain-containing protein [Aureitalea sp. L0-47]